MTQAEEVGDRLGTSGEVVEGESPMRQEQQTSCRFGATSLFYDDDLELLAPPPRTPTSAEKRRVTRCLFGRPDPQEQKLWLNEKLADIYAQQKTNWNFDFATESPSTSEKSQDSPDSGFWEWTPVSASQLPLAYAPRVYPAATPKVTPRNTSSTIAQTASTSSEQKQQQSTTKITGYFNSRKRLHGALGETVDGGVKKAAKRLSGRSGPTPMRRNASGSSSGATTAKVPRRTNLTLDFTALCGGGGGTTTSSSTAPSASVSSL